MIGLTLFVGVVIANYTENRVRNLSVSFPFFEGIIFTFLILFHKNAHSIHKIYCREPPCSRWINGVGTT